MRQRFASAHRYFHSAFLALAHRGGSLLPGNIGRENTLHAFRSAVDLGYTHVETDVHATRDGHIVAFHDDCLDRVTDRTGLISHLSLDQVKRARVGDCDDIPALDELFEEFPDTNFNIDIKSPGAVVGLAEAINRHQAHRRVCVASFSATRLHHFRRLMGAQIPTAVGPQGVVAAAYGPASTTFFSSPGVAFQIPTHFTWRGRTLPVLTPKLIRRAHALGKEVHIWTVDDRRTMITLIDQGVDGIVTDRPDILKDVLVERDLWHCT